MKNYQNSIPRDLSYIAYRVCIEFLPFEFKIQLVLHSYAVYESVGTDSFFPSCMSE